MAKRNEIGLLRHETHQIQDIYFIICWLGAHFGRLSSQTFELHNAPRIPFLHEGCALPARNSESVSVMITLACPSSLAWNIMSQYGGFLKWGTPRSSSLMGFSIINQPFRGTPMYGNPHMFWPSISSLNPKWSASARWQCIGKLPVVQICSHRHFKTSFHREHGSPSWCSNPQDLSNS